MATASVVAENVLSVSNVVRSRRLVLCLYPPSPPPSLLCLVSKGPNKRGGCSSFNGERIQSAWRVRGLGRPPMRMTVFRVLVVSRREMTTTTQSATTSEQPLDGKRTRGTLSQVDDNRQRRRMDRHDELSVNRACAFESNLER
mmetsp:Transcript_6217/g.26049  ORF Transcript_6217/g.26049 Transcript_6217/m.26049 type:complete len:143 (+) Transcript_6217:646-1074(+)